MRTLAFRLPPQRPVARADASMWLHLFSLPGSVPQTQPRQASLCCSRRPTAPAPIPVLALLAARPCQFVPFRSKLTASSLSSLLATCVHAVSPSACFRLCALALVSATHSLFCLPYARTLIPSASCPRTYDGTFSPSAFSFIPRWHRPMSASINRVSGAITLFVAPAHIPHSLHSASHTRQLSAI